VFKVKSDAKGNVKYKAQLVAIGFTQVYGTDYFETFSKVVRRSTIRLLLALAVEYDMEIYHFDVCTAFRTVTWRKRHICVNL
jgi:histone deacetylase 1/2